MEENDKNVFLYLCIFIKILFLIRCTVYLQGIVKTYKTNKFCFKLKLKNETSPCGRRVFCLNILHGEMRKCNIIITILIVINIINKQ